MCVSVCEGSGVFRVRVSVGRSLGRCLWVSVCVRACVRIFSPFCFCLFAFRGGSCGGSGIHYAPSEYYMKKLTANGLIILPAEAENLVMKQCCVRVRREKKSTTERKTNLTVISLRCVP